MIRHTNLKHRFIQHIPESIEDGILYISIDFSTAIHSCCCGCGEEIVTPISPTGWKLTYDGETISLWPSIGNWNIACRSHYIIKESRIIEAAPWTNRQIILSHKMNKAVKSGFYEGREDVDTNQTAPIQHPHNGVIANSWLWIKGVMLGKKDMSYIKNSKGKNL